MSTAVRPRTQPPFPRRWLGALAGVFLAVSLVPVVTGVGAAHAVAAPQTTLVSGPTRPVSTSTTATFEFTSVPELAEYQCSTDDAAFVSCTSPFDVTGLADGAHTFAVRAVTDQGVDRTPATWAWSVDAGGAAAPSTRMASGPPQPTYSDVATFIFSASPTDAKFQCKRDDQEWVACRSPRRETGVAAGDHVFAVRAVKAGVPDATPAEYAWTVRGADAPLPQRNLNILVINMDDMRADGTLHVMPKTRRWFAQGGTSFPNGYVTTPDCCPSRSTFMSGRYTHNHGNKNNQTTKRLDHASTIAAYLDEAGYQTGMAGRFLMSWPPSIPPPSYDRWAVTANGYAHALFGTDQGEVTADYGTTEIGRQAIRMMEDFQREDRRPFFLYLAPYAPHTPFTAEPQYATADVGECVPTPAMAEADRSDKPTWVQNNSAKTDVGCARRAAQLRTLLSADDMVDAVMTRLAELGEDDNTVAIFTSDNGFAWSEHGLTGKFSPYDESIRVPFLVRWPGKVAAGATDRRLVANVDILPSALEAAAVTPDLRHPIDGKSFLSYSGLSQRERSEAFLEYFQDSYKADFPDWASIRTSHMQFIEWYDDAGQVEFSEYYDLDADPFQLVNLLGDDVTGNAPATGALHRRVTAYRTCSGTTGAARCP